MYKCITVGKEDLCLYDIVYVDRCTLSRHHPYFAASAYGTHNTYLAAVYPVGWS